MEVKDSRPGSFLGQETVCRRRACRKCRFRITTFEIAALPDPRAIARLRAHAELLATSAEAAILAIDDLTKGGKW